MFSLNGFIFKIFQAIPIFLMLLLPQKTECQSAILDSVLTFSVGRVKTGDALDLVTKQTGYNFTYDSRLIDKERQTRMDFKNMRLAIILDSILQDNTLTYSVIDKYIIISRSVTNPTSALDSIPHGKVRYITGKIADEETSDPLPFATIGLKNKGKGTV